MRLKDNGSALSQYIIIIALIALCLVPILFVFGSTINTALKDFYYSLKASEIDSYKGESSIKAGSLLGNPDQPVKICNGGTCAIDYGEFILNGVPDDLSETIKNKDVSGGTDKLIALVNQIADQLQEQGKTDEALAVKKLATMGHNVALIEKAVEKTMLDCKGDRTCVASKLNKKLPKPEGYDESFYSYPDALVYPIYYINIGQNRFDKKKNNATYQSSLSENYPATRFVDEFDNVMTADISDNAKNVIKELYWDVGKLSSDVESGMYYISSGDYIKDYIDPITGNSYDNSDLPTEPIGIYSDYKPSSMTHFDSSLICATGKYDDTGKKCK